MRLYGVTGRKHHGKTTLVERLVAHFTSRGLRVSTVKHAHHGIELDQPGRDSHRHRMAGAAEVVLAGPDRLAFLHELRGAPEWPLDAILAAMQPADLVLVEGYKAAPHRKLEVYRAQAANGAPPLAEENPSIRAVAGDATARGLPQLPLDDIEAIARFVWDDAEDRAA